MKWIKHDTDANQDAKLQNVLLDYGLEGYGLYWYCIELIAGKVSKDSITFELEHDARIIARNTGSTPQKVEEMMRYFVDLGLFESSEGVITCLKLARRLDSSMTSNPEMRKIITHMKNHDGVMTQSEKPMQDKIRLEENKENVGSGKPTPAIDKEAVQDGFEYFWSIWIQCKKTMGVKNNSSKKETWEKKWKPMFNNAFWKKHGQEGFDEEVNAICEYAKQIHASDDEFNPARNLMTGKFFTREGWKDE
ncbi:MAG: Lin1244/Lin1753 domain-containing protein [Marinomonas gallaica]